LVPGPIARNAARILAFLAEERDAGYLDGPALAAGTGLLPDDLNDAVEILAEDGYVERERFFNTAPFTFGIVRITSRGRYEFERAQELTGESAGDREPAPLTPLPALEAELRTRPPIPVGSPYGFTDED
jgi:DNA-binding MarR family transcriptional regulator